MNRFPFFPKRRALFLIACLLVLEACTPPKSTTDPISVASSSTLMVQNQDSTAVSTTSQFHLVSYRVVYSRLVEGTLDGSPYHSSDQITRTLVSNPVAEDSILQTILPDGQTIYLRYVNTGQEQYFQHQPDGTCEGFQDNQQEGQIPNPADLLPHFVLRNKVNEELVNSVPTQHYQLDAGSLGLPGTAIVSGDVWVSVPEGYVVKFGLEVLPHSEPIGVGLDARDIISYELNDINQVNQIELPPSCIPVLAEIPAMPDATAVERRSAALSFLIQSDPSSVKAFYDQVLANLGWQPEQQANDSSQNEFSYRKGDQALSFLLDSTPEGLDVYVSRHDTSAMLGPNNLNPVEGSAENIEPNPLLEATPDPYLFGEDELPTLPVDQFPAAIQTLMAELTPSP